MNKIILLTLVSAFILTFGSANAEPKEMATINGKPGTYLYVMASYAPLEYLSGGVVSIQDSRGNIIARGKTNTRGVFVVPLVESKYKHLPLKVTVTGGKIISQNGDLYTGPKFKGHLKGQITTVPKASGTTLYLDFLTTAASVMTSKKISYDASFDKVREAIGINPDESMSVLRYVNSHVGKLEVEREVARAKGYDRLVKEFASKVGNGDKISWLKPSRESWDQMVSALSDAHLASDAVKPLLLDASKETTTGHTLASDAPVVCPPVPNGSVSSGPSTESIVQFGVLAAKELLAYVAVPGGGLIEGTVGMIFSGLSTGSDPTEEAIERVQQQLACISSQIAAVNEEILDLSFREAVKPALDCKDVAENQFKYYQIAIEAAMPNADGSSSSVKLDSSNQNLKKLVDYWGPTGGLVENCGATGSKIDSMLFANDSSGQASAWQKLNIKYQSDFIWYTQAETQSLQRFLAYWSEILYKVFVLTNEYYNYYGDFKTAEILAGADPDQPQFCKYDPTGEYDNFCARESNIHHAYPADLYSDEIAIPGTGNAVVPYPAGLAIGIGQLGLNLSYIVKHSSGKRNEYYANTAAAAALTQWNLNVDQGIYRSCPEEIAEEASVVETFDCPKTLRTNAYEKDYWPLASNNPNGKSPADFLLSAINQSQRSEWKNLTSSGSDISFWTYDQLSHFVYEEQDKTKVFLGSMVNREEVLADCVKDDYDYFGAPTKCSPDQHPVMGVLLGRTWWDGASTATRYIPPPPPTPPAP